MITITTQQVPEGFSETIAWIAKYPRGAVAALLRGARNRPRVPQAPARKATLIGMQAQEKYIRS